MDHVSSRALRFAAVDYDPDEQEALALADELRVRVQRERAAVRRLLDHLRGARATDDARS